jgi:dihydrofolate reductase
MSKIVAEISMSLDGFVTGPNPDLEHGLGTGGEALHAWVFAPDDEVVQQVVGDGVLATGAVVMGRRTFDFIDGPNGWGEEMGYSPDRNFTPPGFVVTHRTPDSVRLASQFSFVRDGLEAAIIKARTAAGDKNVSVMGGGDLVRQSVMSGLVDELRIHLAPVVLGAGTPLFRGDESRSLVQQSVSVSSLATHITYQVRAT